MDAPLNMIEVAHGVLMDRLSIDVAQAQTQLLDQAIAFQMPIEQVADIVCSTGENVLRK